MGLFSIDKGNNVESAVKSALENLKMFTSYDDAFYLLNLALHDIYRALDRANNFDTVFTKHNGLLNLLTHKFPPELIERRNALLSDINRAIDVGSIESLIIDITGYNNLELAVRIEESKKERLETESEIKVLVNKANKYIDKGLLADANIIAKLIKDDLCDSTLLILKYHVEHTVGGSLELWKSHSSKLSDYGIFAKVDDNVYKVNDIGKLIYVHCN